MRGRSGVSTVIGAAIFVAIVFMIVIPLLIFMQRSSEIYQLEALRAYRREVEKLNQDLNVHVSLKLSSKTPVFIVENKGAMMINISSICYTSTDVSQPANCYETKIRVPQALVRIIDLSYYDPSFTLKDGELYFFKLVSDKGRIYQGREVMNSSNPPYNLLVEVSNMKYDRRYVVSVSVADLYGVDVGCVYDSETKDCKLNAVQELYTYTWNQNNTFSFRAFPGNYTIEVERYYWNVDHWELEEKVFARSILLKDNSVVQVGEKHEPAKPIDLNKYLNFTILVPGVQMTSEDDLTFNVSVIVRLIQDKNVTENLRDAVISLEVIKRTGCTGVAVSPKKQVIEMLKPGQTAAVTFNIDVQGIGDLGAVVYLKATLDSAVGERTGEGYSGISRTTAISICKLSNTTMVMYSFLGESGCGSCLTNCEGDCKNYCASHNYTYVGYVCVLVNAFPPKCRCMCIFESPTGVIPRCGIP
ncbi:MAG: hypothetical protein DRN60_01935 [Thaumarchaeota archaeon]|nr:MAG: hypothetical protein DRN60_01935 [Nitrososphaerota archaeon]